MEWSTDRHYIRSLSQTSARLTLFVCVRFRQEANTVESCLLMFLEQLSVYSTYLKELRNVIKEGPKTEPLLLDVFKGLSVYFLTHP